MQRYFIHHLVHVANWQVGPHKEGEDATARTQTSPYGCVFVILYQSCLYAL